MHILLAIGVTILATTQAQTQPSLAETKPMSITFISSVPLEKAISTLAQVTSTTIEFDQTVAADVRIGPISSSTVDMRDVTLEEAIAILTKLNGLSYAIVDAKTVRIFKKG